MWPFSTPASVSKLQERLETVERDMRNLRLDWEATYEKIRTLMARLAKRAEKLDTASPGLATGESEEIVPAALSPTYSRLTPRQKQIQIQIMQRRKANGGP